MTVDTDNILLDIVRHIGDLNSTLGAIAKALEKKHGGGCTDPDRRDGHCCGMPDSEDIDDWVSFVRGNPYAGDVTPEVMVDLMPYAVVPAGNTWVLQRQTEAGFYVKLHDTWGMGPGEGKITLHVFDPDGATVEAARFFDRANTAGALFLDDAYLDDLWEKAKADHVRRGEAFRQ